MSPRPGQPIVLRHAERRVTDKGDRTNGRADWARGVRGCLTWGIPVALLVISPERYFFIVWPIVLTFMGGTCLLNAHRCGRIHWLFHRTVLPGARGRRISIWRRRAAAGRTGMVEAVPGFADRERGALLLARTGPRSIPASVLITYFEWNLNYWYHRSFEHALLLRSVPSNGS